MSEVHTVDHEHLARTSRVPSEATALELEDMLYDILANGADPSLADGTLEAVQTFLHEHARQKRSLAEFTAFFARHGLSTAKENPLSIALPPMELRGAPPLPIQQHVEAIEVVPVSAAPVAPRDRRLAWLFGVAALAAVSGAGYAAVTVAQAEFERVRTESRANAEQLVRVQAEAASLRQSLERNSEHLRRIDNKSELLLQTLASPLDPNAR